MNLAGYDAGKAEQAAPPHEIIEQLKAARTKWYEAFVPISQEDENFLDAIGAVQALASEQAARIEELTTSRDKWKQRCDRLADKLIEISERALKNHEKELIEENRRLLEAVPEEDGFVG